ncbi:hypothetical protein QEJ31_09955 [Pigmentibacter sp. JX0631]|uniref:hypothetical protein n=1 Tax=Pigmentibacter sp. JX0631 TaxID=2976982 RepID=UPI0024690EF0|nr:hypothetical protein [Pigmentibacter sp. JX0631]WGL58846.1 hypothetical protein QEJ31_09955 [Pigmentibacter sp. JX0631]
MQENHYDLFDIKIELKEFTEYNLSRYGNEMFKTVYRCRPENSYRTLCRHGGCRY